MNVPIQKDSITNILIGLFICAIIILWTLRSDIKDAKKTTKKNIYEKSLSWRVYFISGLVFFNFLI